MLALKFDARPRDLIDGRVNPLRSRDHKAKFQPSSACSPSPNKILCLPFPRIQIAPHVCSGLTSIPSQPSKQALDLVLSKLQAAGARVHHVIGNHELLAPTLCPFPFLCTATSTSHTRASRYNFNRVELLSHLPLPPGVFLADPTDAYYYNFTPCTGWRCIVLDSFDIALDDGRPAGKSRSAKARAARTACWLSCAPVGSLSRVISVASRWILSFPHFVFKDLLKAPLLAT